MELKIRQRINAISVVVVSQVSYSASQLLKCFNKINIINMTTKKNLNAFYMEFFVCCHINFVKALLLIIFHRIGLLESLDIYSVYS